MMRTNNLIPSQKQGAHTHPFLQARRSAHASQAPWNAVKERTTADANVLANGDQSTAHIGTRPPTESNDKQTHRWETSHRQPWEN